MSDFAYLNIGCLRWVQLAVSIQLMSWDSSNYHLEDLGNLYPGIHLSFTKTGDEAVNPVCDAREAQAYCRLVICLRGHKLPCHEEARSLRIPHSASQTLGSC
ncbi:uncharacterized protein LOC117920045 isoform X2 [Vitis riparia]|uniref:uncharacterized protein LOC117920045 isoform X2 n=1 Tax=Vitis riparia TaxID=96939 RepID=UPI00155AC8D7|nr:uncharacterized protein LOC117920045 isoform X2 [Vitis riparia]